MKLSSGTLKSWQFWLLNVMGVLALVLVLINMTLFKENRELRNEINERQQFVNQSIQLSRLNNEIIKSLAQLAASKQDEQITHLLTSHGIKFTVTNQKKQN
jgi:predicted Holliday junction resolvase-like endonuclease